MTVYQHTIKQVHTSSPLQNNNVGTPIIWPWARAQFASGSGSGSEPRNWTPGLTGAGTRLGSDSWTLCRVTDCKDMKDQKTGKTELLSKVEHCCQYCRHRVWSLDLL